MNLSKRIILYVSLLVLLISAGLGVTALVFGDRIITGQAEEALLSQAEDGARLVSEMVSLRLEILQELATRAAVSGMNWDEQVESLSRDIQRLGYLDFGIVTPDGNVRYISDGNTTNLADREYVKRALAGERNVSDVIISRVTDQSVLTYAVPIMDGDRVHGALIARRDGNALSLITDTMGFGETGYAYAINRQGTVVAHGNREYVMGQFTPIVQAQEDASLTPLAATFESILRNETGVGSYSFNSNNLYNGYAPVAGTDWILVVTANRAEVLSGLNELRTILLIGSLVFLVLGAAIAFFIGRSIATPITRLSTALAQLAQYDLSFDENSEAMRYRNRSDEIGIIASSLATMQQNLITLIKQISENAQQVASSSEELTATSHQSSTAANEVAKTIEEIADGASQQARDTETGVVNISELGGLIEDDQQQVVLLNRAAEQVGALKDEGNKSLQLVVAKTTESGEATKAVKQIIRMTDEGAKQIETASTMIQSIAEQTNLLALNAAIESARAGEAGRGFAVVAEEIRKLAEQSSQFTTEIDGIVKSLKDRTGEAVVTMDKMEKLVEMQHESVQETAGKFEGIDEAVQQMQVVIQYLNASGKAMEQKKQEMIHVMENLSAISEENAAGTQQASASVEEQTAAMDEIARASETLAQLAEEMNQGIMQFTY
ncbi:methyl-accepting chemotaxis protein [Anoxynatronum buryatiense]|nr:methyl-accepting chemotaxis protein [Anoxynatronum buryatiense]